MLHGSNTFTGKWQLHRHEYFSSGTTASPQLHWKRKRHRDNVTGIVAIANGGTGSNTAAGARTNLDIPAVHVQHFSAAIRFRPAHGKRGSVN